MAEQNHSQSGNTTTSQDNKSGEIKGNEPMGQNERKPEQAGTDHSKTDMERKEKSAIGGGDAKGQSGNQPSGQSADQAKTSEKRSTEPTGQGR